MTGHGPGELGWTVQEAADRLGVSPNTIRRWADDGKLSHNRTPGGQRRVPEAAILAFLDATRRFDSHTTDEPNRG